VWQAPRFGSVSETGRLVTINALSTIPYFRAFVSSFRLYLSLFGYFRFLRFTSSVQRSSAPRQQVRVYLCHLRSALSHNSVCFICSTLFVLLVILVGVFVVLSYPVRLYLFAYFDQFVIIIIFFLFQPVTNLYL